MSSQNSNHVMNIINYLKEKKKLAESKVKDYQGPIISDIAKTSPHMQLDYTRQNAIIDTLDEVLMTIEQFCGEAVQEKKVAAKPRKPNAKRE